MLCGVGDTARPLAKTIPSYMEGARICRQIRDTQTSAHMKLMSDRFQNDIELNHRLIYDDSYHPDQLIVILKSYHIRCVIYLIMSNIVQE